MEMQQRDVIRLLISSQRFVLSSRNAAIKHIQVLRHCHKSFVASPPHGIKVCADFMSLTQRLQSFVKKWDNKWIFPTYVSKCWPHSRLELALQRQDPRFQPPLLWSGAENLQGLMHHIPRLPTLCSGDVSGFPGMVGGTQKITLRHLTFGWQKTGTKPRVSSQGVGSMRTQEQEQVMAEAGSGEVNCASPWTQIKATLSFHDFSNTKTWNLNGI